MNSSFILRVGALVPLVLLFACETESGRLPAEIDAISAGRLHSLDNSEWSEPVNLGDAINTELDELNPALSPDGLSVYFVSNRPPDRGGLGLADIWVSRRECRRCPWQDAVNLGAPVSSDRADGGPGFSPDGRLLFFHSNRGGNNDIHVTRRTNTRDDFAWGDPVPLGPDINTPDVENAPRLLKAGKGGPVLYFNRGAVPLSAADIYYAPVTRRGMPRGPAVLVKELSVDGANDASASVRMDGREIFFWTNRPGAPGGNAIMVSTRRSVRDAWSAPEYLGEAVNEFGAIHPDLSNRGRTLLFAAERPDGFGGNDIWMSIRGPSGDDGDDDDDDDDDDEEEEEEEDGDDA